MAVVMLGEHHGNASAIGGSDGRTDAPIVGVQDVEPSGTQQHPDGAPKPRVRYRHGMRSLRIAVEPGQMLCRRPEAVNGDVPVEERAGRTCHSDGGDLHAVAAFDQRMRQISDMPLLPTGDRGIELGEH